MRRENCCVLSRGKIPKTLKTVQLRITIEGVLFEKTFEADPNLKYTYSWRRLNIYRQRVYGTTTAVVRVGYTYDVSECLQGTIWNIQTTKISGQGLPISNIGGWDVDVHHRYNHQEGILYKGDGSNIFLRERPRLIFEVMGDGSQRQLECQGGPSCHSGMALNQKVLTLVSIVSASDGSLYVGDFNLIRKIKPDGTTTTLLKLNTGSGVSYRYTMAINPHDDGLYISDPESHQIIRLKNSNNPSDIDNNWERVVGNGIRCLPGDLDSCGDGGHAKEARLSYPKGLAISSDNIMYFSDGTDIRMVDQDGIISTVVGGLVGQNSQQR